MHPPAADAVALLRALVGDGPSDAELADLLVRVNGDPSAAANHWFDAATPAAAAAPAAPAAPAASSSTSGWPRHLGHVEVEAFSIALQHELDGPLQLNEAVELQGGGGSRRKVAGASSGKRRAVGAEEALLRLCVRGVAVGRMPSVVARWLQPLLTEGRVQAQATVVRARVRDVRA